MIQPLTYFALWQFGRKGLLLYPMMIAAARYLSYLTQATPDVVTNDATMDFWVMWFVYMYLGRYT